MPRTATKGTRTKFYNALARDARCLDTFRIPNSNTDLFPPSPTISNTYDLPSKNGITNVIDSHVSPRIGIGNEEEEGGWGSISASSWNSHRNYSVAPTENHNTRKKEDRARGNQELQPSTVYSINPSNTSIPVHPRINLPLNPSGRRTPTSKQKVQSWITSSRDKTTHKPTNHTSFESPTPVSSRPLVTYPDSIAPERTKMNYNIHDDAPSVSQRRYGDYSRTGNRPQATDYHQRERETYRTYNAEPRHILSPRPGISSMRLPTDLHHTDPYSSTDIYAYKAGDNGALNFRKNAGEIENVEREREAALRKVEELERRLDDARRLHPQAFASYPPGRAGVERMDDSQDIRRMREDNLTLRETITRQNNIIESADHRIKELEGSSRLYDVSSSELIDLKSKIDQLNQDNITLNHLILSTDKQLEEEKTKREKAESENESSKKSQSSTAKILSQTENKVKALELKMVELEEKERRGRELKDMFEKRIRILENEKANWEKEKEISKGKMTNSNREKENAILKYKSTETDNKKLSDKIQLLRREKDALSARLEELLAEVGISSYAYSTIFFIDHSNKEVLWERAAENTKTNEQDKGILENRKRLKEELHRERSTSDRLRSERNNMRERYQQLKTRFQLNGEDRSATRLRRSEGVATPEVKIHHPTPASAEKHKPQFSLNDLNLSETPAAANSDQQEDKRGVFEVIEDNDGLKYPSRRVTVEDISDEEAPKYQPNIKSSDTTEERKSSSAPEMKPKPKHGSRLEVISPDLKDLQGLFSPGLSMNSIPLEPKRMNKPTKEEISLFESDKEDTFKGEEESRLKGNASSIEEKVKDRLEEAKKASIKSFMQLNELNESKEKSDSSFFSDIVGSSSVDSDKISRDPFAHLDPMEGKLFTTKSNQPKTTSNPEYGTPSLSEPQPRSQSLNEPSTRMKDLLGSTPNII
ncbi:uncharacterized protein L201_004140 [Kwoniella dendrophila CBS 6074]|uniref:Spindle pole body-associated protein cut12 domain-containing protein n=1 Tax=Kwoniella dendrophila CBS 6074 TaxID=1295534 RepID=A0AAX4JV59_9TREE